MKKKVFVDVELTFKSYTANILLESVVTLGTYDDGGFGDLTPRP